MSSLSGKTSSEDKDDGNAHLRMLGVCAREASSSSSRSEADWMLRTLHHVAAECERRFPGWSKPDLLSLATLPVQDSDVGAIVQGQMDASQAAAFLLGQAAFTAPNTPLAGALVSNLAELRLLDLFVEDATVVLQLIAMNQASGGPSAHAVVFGRGEEITMPERARHLKNRALLAQRQIQQSNNPIMAEQIRKASALRLIDFLVEINAIPIYFWSGGVDMPPFRPLGGGGDKMAILESLQTIFSKTKDSLATFFEQDEQGRAVAFLINSHLCPLSTASAHSAHSALGCLESLVQKRLTFRG